MKHGTIYIISTPIGNYEDITLRALRMLEEVDLIAAEDTRNTGMLLSHHQIKTRMISFHEHNENERSEELIEKLRNGLSIGLMSDAGTPAVSDPGYRLIRKAHDNVIPVVPIPGPCAAVTALSASGLPTDAFVFAGFPPKTKSKRLQFLKDLNKDRRTIVFFSSPKRIISFMDEILHAMGDRFSVLAREMTKPYEEFIRGPISAIQNQLARRNAVKGEITLIVKGADSGADIDWKIITEEMQILLRESGMSVGGVAKIISNRYGVPRKTIYDNAVAFRSNNKKG